VSRTADHRELVSRLFADLQIKSFEPLGDGRACFTYEVNGTWIAQLPRVPAEDERLRRRARLLPELAREVGVPIPALELVSEDPACYVYRKIEGHPVEPGERGVWPERLGRFLYDLHSVAPEFVGMRAQGVSAVRDSMRSELDALCDTVLPLLERPERIAASAWIHAFEDDDRNLRFAPCLTHGSIGPEHVLVGPDGDLAGVLDWSHTSVGDPAADFAWILSASPDRGEHALAAYGGAPDDRFRDRCAFAFAMLPWYEALDGVSTGRPELVRSGLAGVRSRARAWLR
jgi:aminoglycoside phosphotransferase (APT) family kinase protein